MERLIALLREKNHCLEKFYYLNEQELLNFGVGNFDSLEPFYQARETILDMIKRIDAAVDDMNTNELKDMSGVSEGERQEVASILSAKDELVKAVLAQDLQALTYIEKEKSNIIRELRTTQQTKRAVGAYANSERMKALDQE